MTTTTAAAAAKVPPKRKIVSVHEKKKQHMKKKKDLTIKLCDLKGKREKHIIFEVKKKLQKSLWKYNIAATINNNDWFHNNVIGKKHSLAILMCAYLFKCT